MIKFVKRHTDRACSQKILARRVAYLVDTGHKNHRDKILGTPRNYHCPNDSADAFMDEVARIEDEYRKFRAGKRGKRTRRIFEEIVYSSPYFANLTDEELDIAEEMVVTALVPNSAARTNRHKCKETGRTDFHILFCAKTSDYPPITTLWSQFGGTGKACIFPALDNLDHEIVRRINAHRKPQHKIKSRLDVRREHAIAVKGQKPPLAQEIAEANPTLRITAKSIRSTIETIGHSVPKLTEHFISVIFAGAKRPRRYNLPELLEAIALAQDDGHHGNTAPPSIITTATPGPVPGAPSAPGTLSAYKSASMPEAPRATSEPKSPAEPNLRRRRRRPKPPSLR